MMYRFAKRESHSFNAVFDTFTEIKEAIRSWYPRADFSKLDERKEGWVYNDGKLLGYLDIGVYIK